MYQELVTLAQEVWKETLIEISNEKEALAGDTFRNRMKTKIRDVLTEHFPDEMELVRVKVYPVADQNWECEWKMDLEIVEVIAVV